MTKSQKLAQLRDYLKHAEKFREEHRLAHAAEGSEGGGYQLYPEGGECCSLLDWDVHRLDSQIKYIEVDGNPSDHEGYQWFELTPFAVSNGIQSGYSPALVGVLRWSGPIDGRPPAKPLHYCSSTHTWSRVLWVELDPEEGGSTWYTEVSLIPHNDDEWQTHIARVEIRRHCTARAFYDREERKLPREVRAKMVENLGSVLTQELLEGDIFSQIDWALYKEQPNGPVPLEVCRKK